MQLGSPIAPLEILRHRSKSNPPHPSQTQRRMGHPQGLRLNFEVTCLSGVVLRRAPSIVETRQETEKVRPPADLKFRFCFAEHEARYHAAVKKFDW